MKKNYVKTRLFKVLTNNQDALAFTKAGLTQEAMSHPLDHHVLWDMPGLYQKGYIHEFLAYKTYKKLIPTKRIKPKIYQLKKSQSLIIEGLITISIMKQDASVVLYVSDLVKIHKTNDQKVKGLLNDREHQFDIYVDTYEEKSFKLTDRKTQITFADFGFMHVDCLNTIKVNYPKGMHITLTEALFK